MLTLHFKHFENKISTEKLVNTIANISLKILEKKIKIARQKMVFVLKITDRSTTKAWLLKCGAVKPRRTLKRSRKSGAAELWGG